MKRWGVVLAVLALAFATMGQDGCDTGTEEPADTDTNGAENTEPSEEEEEATPEPEANVRSNCDYLLRFSDDYGSNDHRFVAGATVENTGNIGVVIRFKARWTLLGGEPATAQKTVRVKRGGTREVQISLPASSDQIDAHQSANGKCSAKGTIVDTFGKAR